MQRDIEKKKTTGAKTYAATSDDWPDDVPEPGVWWTEQDEPVDEASEDAPLDSEVWFEEALEAMNEEPNDEMVLANFMEAKKAFYKDARKALDQSRVNRGFYPNSKGKGKSKGSEKGKNYGRAVPFKGKCMRCGKYGHKAQFCPQATRSSQSRGKGAGVGFVFTNGDEELEPQTSPTEDEQPSTTEVESVYSAAMSPTITRAILDCGASETIVGAWTLQQLGDELHSLGFAPDEEISVDHSIRKKFVFGKIDE